MTELSPAALAVWEAFNQNEAGVFVDYGDKLAAALRAAADQCDPDWQGLTCIYTLHEIATELEDQ